MDPTVNIGIKAKDETAKAFGQVGRNLDGLAKKSDVAKAAMAALAGPLSVAGLALVARGAINAGDEINTLSEKFGVSAEALSQYRYVATQTGTDLAGMASAIKFTQKNLDAAADPASAMAKEFAALGLSVQALRAMAPDQAFEAIGAAIARLPDEAARTGTFMKLMGKQGADMGPMFAEGAAGIAAMRAEADRLGLTMSGSTAKSLDAAADAMGTLKIAGTNLAASLVSTVGPAIAGMATGLTKALGWANDKALVYQAGLVTNYRNLTADQLAQVDDVMAQHGIKAAAAFALEQVELNKSWTLARDLTEQYKALGGADDALLQNAAEWRGLQAEKARAEAQAEKDLEQKQRERAVILALADGFTQAAAAVNAFGVTATGGGYLQKLLDECRAVNFELDPMAIKLDRVGEAATKSFTLAQEAARYAADGIAASFTSAVFDAKAKLLDLQDVARGIFGMLVSYGLRLGLSMLVPALAPVMGFPKSAAPAGADKAGQPAGTKAAAAADKVAPPPAGNISLVVNVQGIVDVTDRMSIRRLTTAIHEDLERVRRFNGAGVMA